METGDWRIVMFIDGTDTEGKATYQQIYQHQDGRKACVGPGFCSDPDLEWLLLQKDRKIKTWNKKHTKRKKNHSLCFLCSLDFHSHTRSLGNSRTWSLGSIFSMGLWGNTNIQFWTH